MYSFTFIWSKLTYINLNKSVLVQKYFRVQNNVQPLNVCRGRWNVYYKRTLDIFLYIWHLVLYITWFFYVTCLTFMLFWFLLEVSAVFMARSCELWPWYESMSKLLELGPILCSDTLAFEWAENQVIFYVK